MPDLAEVLQTVADRVGEIKENMAQFRTELDELRSARSLEEADSPNMRRYRLAEEALVRAERDQVEPGLRIAMLSRAMLASRGQFSTAMDLIRSWAGSDGAKWTQEIQRAMDANTAEAGAAIVPQNWANELIPLLRPYSILADAAPRKVPIPAGGTLSLPRVAAGALTSWGPSGRVKIKQGSKPSLKPVTLQQRPLQALVGISKDLVSVASISVDQFVRDDILLSMGVALDQAHLFGSGDENEPIGLLTAGSGSNFLSGISRYGVGALPTWKLPVNVYGAHCSNNGTLMRPQYVMGPTLFALLCTSESTNGYPVLYNEMSNNRLFRFPYKVSSLIPNKAVSHSPTWFGLFDYAEYLWGEFESFSTAYSTEAAYIDETGNVSYPFQQNDLVARVTWKGDLKARQLASFTACDDVWTA